MIIASRSPAWFPSRRSPSRILTASFGWTKQRFLRISILSCAGSGSTKSAMFRFGRPAGTWRDALQQGFGHVTRGTKGQEPSSAVVEPAPSVGVHDGGYAGPAAADGAQIVGRGLLANCCRGA